MRSFEFAILSFILFIVFTGCSIFDIFQKKMTQGNISENTFKIQKIIIKNQIYEAPQILAKEAKSRLRSKTLNSKPQPRAKNLQSKDEVLAAIKSVATMTFNTKEGRIFGSSGCGSYFANYTWKNRNTISISDNTRTRPICNPTEVTRFDFNFLRNFRGNFRMIEPNDGTLILQSSNMTIYLTK